VSSTEAESTTHEESWSIGRFYKQYFGVSSVATPGDVRDDLWTKGLGPPYADEGSKEYASTVLAQYQMYVEMTDRNSARRGLTNTFFLTLNSAIFTAIGFFFINRPHAASWLLVFPAIVLVAECMAWFWQIRSYRQLNSGKFAVIGAFEEKLPASPYWRAEWTALGKGQDPGRYWQVSHLEQWVPILFAVAYLGGFIAVVASS
jgi:hypothetical protein